MSRIIKYKEQVERIEHNLFFPHAPGNMNSGFSFTCNEAGIVERDKLPAEAQKNYDMCITERVHLGVIQTRTYQDWEPGEMVCDCGKHLSMYRPGADIHCECKRSYNSAGQLLAPREQWGEETGETAADYDRGFNNPEIAFDE